LVLNGQLRIKGRKQTGIEKAEEMENDQKLIGKMAKEWRNGGRRDKL
jgi:hypothetical protein